MQKFHQRDKQPSYTSGTIIGTILKMDEGRTSMDRRTIKPMTMHKTLYLRDDVDRLYMSRKEGGRGLVSIEDSIDTIDTMTRRQHKKAQRQITVIRNNANNTRIKRITMTRKQKIGRKTTVRMLQATNEENLII